MNLLNNPHIADGIVLLASFFIGVFFIVIKVFPALRAYLDKRSESIKTGYDALLDLEREARKYLLSVRTRQQAMLNDGQLESKVRDAEIEAEKQKREISLESERLINLRVAAIELRCAQMLREMKEEFSTAIVDEAAAIVKTIVISNREKDGNNDKSVMKCIDSLQQQCKKDQN